MRIESPWGQETQYFYQLQDKVMSAVEADGLDTNGWCLPYHCLENRVYEIGIELKYVPQNPSEKFRIAKFYRPGRWNREQIQEEHDFLLELEENEIPAVAPLKFKDGETLHQIPGGEIFFCLFPKVGGRNLYEFNIDQLERLGRTLARIHSVGKSRPAKHRVEIGPESYGQANLDFMLKSELLPARFKKQYEDTIELCLAKIRPLFKNLKKQRVHGDCHLGNILYRDEVPFFVDFDDFVMGPPVQDFWLLFPTRDEEQKIQFDIFLEAYETINSFDRETLKLIEPLRTLRMINYTAWLTKRIEDPVFKQSFPHFGGDQYWQEHIQDLAAQMPFLNQL